MEQAWSDNRLTAEGSLLHSNVDNPLYRQLNNGVITLRSVKVASKELGLYGVTDAVELLPEEDINKVAMCHPGYPGRWRPFVVEYKHGSPKRDECDEVQLAAQVMCIEEMYGVTIPESALFYFETKHREVIPIDRELRSLTKILAREMHEVFESGTTPSPCYKKHCKRCSLYDLCLPEMEKCTSVTTYLKNNLYEETS